MLSIPRPPFFLCLCHVEGKAGAYDWLLGKIKPFSRVFVNPEYGGGTAGAHIRIDFFRIEIFADRPGRCLARSPLSCPARTRPRWKGIFTLHGGKGDILIGFEPLVKVLALGGQEVKAFSS